MIWYLLGSIITAFLIGLIIGIATGKTQGFSLANDQYQQQMATALWTQYLNQFQGGLNEEESDDTETA